MPKAVFVIIHGCLNNCQGSFMLFILSYKAYSVTKKALDIYISRFTREKHYLLKFCVTFKEHKVPLMNDKSSSIGKNK